MPYSFTAKLDRAYEHLNAFECESGPWIEGQATRIVDEPDLDPPEDQIRDYCNGMVRRRFRVTGVDEVPSRFGVLIGDCLFNLRSALDHLALSLGLAHTPAMSSKQIKSSAFPIFAFQPTDRKKMHAMVGCVHPSAFKIVAGMQPYTRGSNYASHPLWQIHELNIIDKHRRLTMVSGIPLVTDSTGHGELAVAMRVPEGGFNIQFDRPSYLKCISENFYPLKANAVLAQYGGTPIDRTRNMKMHPELPLQVMFGDGGPTTIGPVSPTLKGLCDFVRDGVIVPLEKFLP